MGWGRAIEFVHETRKKGWHRTRATETLLKRSAEPVSKSQNIQILNKLFRFHGGGKKPISTPRMEMERTAYHS